MRTPPCSGRYTPGSTVTTWPARERVGRASATPTGASWISRPDAVAGAVDERVAPAGRRRSRRGRPRRRRRPLTPGAHRGHARGLRARPRRRASRCCVGDGLADARPCGSCRSSSRRPARRSRCTTRSPSRDRARADGRWWGLAPFGPGRRRSSRSELPSAPEPPDLGVERERELRLGRASASSGDRASASSAIGAAASMRATSPSSFTSRSVLDQARRWRTSSASGNQSLGVAPLLRPGDACRPRGRCRAMPRPRPRRTSRCAGRSTADLDPGVDAGRAELLGRLLAVAAVGHEHQRRRRRRASSAADPVKPVR